MSKSKTLFADSDDSLEEDTSTLAINKIYADKYSKWREAEELQHLKEKYGDNPEDLESDSESSCDEYVNPDNAEFDRDFLKTLAVIHSKDDDILDEENKTRFFKDRYESSKSREKEEKPITIGDYQRQIFLEKGGILEEEDENERTDYLVRETAPIKQGKKTIGFENDNIEMSDEEEVFAKSASTSNKLQQGTEEKDDVIQFMQGSVKSLKEKDDERVLSNLRDAWKDEKLSKKERWLKDFFLNKRYLEEEEDEAVASSSNYIVDEETISEDEATLNKLDEFETKYRFRFEQPDEEFIKKYPRIISDTLRIKDDKRKQARDSKKRRGEEAKERRRQEIMQLKALKRKEVLNKIDEIQKIAGNEIEIQETDLDGDFDPAEHDAAMSKIFDEEYYGEDNAEQIKPTFEEDDDIYEDYDDWLLKSRPQDPLEGPSGIQHTSNEDYTEGEPVYDIDHPDFNMDADYVPTKDGIRKEMIEATSSRKRTRRRQHKLSEVLEKPKPSYDPQMGPFNEYYDKYYEMDFEDIVAGLPVRFKYRTVQSNSFGLSTEEILSARDKELNKWYPIKKMMAFNRSNAQETKEAKNFSHRATLTRVKGKILPSLFAQDQEEILEADQVKKREKYLKKKSRKQRKLALEGKAPPPDNFVKNNENDPYERSRKRKRKKTDEDQKVTKENPESVYNSSKDNDTAEIKVTKIKKSLLDDSTLEAHQSAVTSTIDTDEGLNKATDSKNKSQKYNNKPKVGKRSKLNEDKTEKIFSGISDARLAAYGQNPKKLKNKLKYTSKS